MKVEASSSNIKLGRVRLRKRAVTDVTKRLLNQVLMNFLAWEGCSTSFVRSDGLLPPLHSSPLSTSPNPATGTLLNYVH